MVKHRSPTFKMSLGLENMVNHRPPTELSILIGELHLKFILVVPPYQPCKGGWRKVSNPQIPNSSQTKPTAARFEYHRICDWFSREQRFAGKPEPFAVFPLLISRRHHALLSQRLSRVPVQAGDGHQIKDMNTGACLLASFNNKQR